MCPENRVHWETRIGPFAVCAATALVAGCVSSGSSREEIVDAMKTRSASGTAGRESVYEPKARIEGKLALKDALRLALKYNRSLRAAYEDREVAQGRILQSRSAALPNVSANGNYARLDAVATFDIGGQQIPMGVEDNYSADLTVRQPVFHGGAIQAEIRTADLAALLTDEQIRHAVQETIFHVSKAYFDVLLARQMLRVNDEALQSAEAHLSDVERKHAKGVASQYDILRARLEVASFRAETIRQRNGINQGTALLLELMGVSQESKAELSDMLTYDPVKPVFEQALRIARENRADLYSGEIGVRMQREALQMARSRYWPQIDAFFTQRWADPDPHSASMVDKWGNAWTAGAAVSIPLFDGSGRDGQVRQEKARLAQKEIDREEAEERAYLEVKRAILDLASAEELVESQRLNLDGAKEGLRLAEVGYKEGIRGEVEVVDARVALTRAATLYTQAVYGHTLARMDLQRAMGILGPTPGNSLPTEPGDPRNKPVLFEGGK